MSVKIFKNNSFEDAGCIKRFDGADWSDVTTAKRFDGTSWQSLLSTAPAEAYTKTYELHDSAVYWSNGSRDEQSVTADSLIHGTWNGSASSSRRSLLLFDPTLLDDISHAQISKIELYIMREASTHGNAGFANVHLKAHGFQSLPTRWTGLDLGFVSAAFSLNRGVGNWFELDSCFANHLGNDWFGIALDSDNSVSMSDYCRFVRRGSNAPRLRITFMR